MTGYQNIINIGWLCQHIPKGLKCRETKQICFEEARKEMQTGIEPLIERMSNGKGIHNNHCSE